MSDLDKLKALGVPDADAQDGVAYAQANGINLAELFGKFLKVLPYIKAILDLIQGGVPASAPKKP